VVLRIEKASRHSVRWAALALLSVILAGEGFLCITLPQSEPPMATAQSGERGELQSTGQEQGPNSPYPISFPKIYATILYLEDQDAPQKVTAEQARALLAPVRALNDAWEVVLDAEHGVKGGLSCEQLSYTQQSKVLCEQVSGTFLSAYKSTSEPNSGVSAEVQASVVILRERAEEPVREQVTLCPQESHDPLSQRSTMLTSASLFDVACAVVMMESSPQLRVRASQAPALLVWFETVVEPLAIVSDAVDEIRDLVTDDQIDVLVRDFESINHVKHKWGGAPILPDGTRERDRLGARVVQILEARIDGRPVPPAPDNPYRDKAGEYVPPEKGPDPEGRGVVRSEPPQP